MYVSAQGPKALNCDARAASDDVPVEILLQWVRGAGDPLLGDIIAPCVHDPLPRHNTRPVSDRLAAWQRGDGVVYTATDPRLDRQVAIKLLPSNLTRDETAKQRFLQEAKAASALDHPNICTIHEINEIDDGQLYLVMAHYEGETLKERIARGPLDLDDALDIATQVGQGLAEAHGAGIVHRDIKPANLLVTKSGVVKILDFGLAKLAGIEGVTQTGTAVGTVAYMSPEQARGQEVDHRTDIWSLGVVLYEMLVGTPPFQGENLLSLSNAILEKEQPSLTGASSSAQGVITRALHKDRVQRYQSVTDLLSELRKLKRSPTVVTPTQPDVPSIAVLTLPPETVPARTLEFGRNDQEAGCHARATAQSKSSPNCAKPRWS